MILNILEVGVVETPLLVIFIRVTSNWQKPALAIHISTLRSETSQTPSKKKGTLKNKVRTSHSHLY